ncbi:type VII secretion target [Actinoplanes sp. NPDC049118]|uniref:type VII secretion target n=1 Tax=Actinoplanes sp. NPDC049118 TaxID=3155769 RepID=UPI0033E68415
MADQFDVDPLQLYRHAANVKAVRDQLAAIKGASQAIAQDAAAYGLLCGWISAILERRHQGQDRLYARAEENLALAAEALIATAREYEAADSRAATEVRKAGRVSGA